MFVFLLQLLRFRVMEISLSFLRYYCVAVIIGAIHTYLAKIVPHDYNLLCSANPCGDC